MMLFSVVMMKVQPPVFAWADEVDITKEVIEKAKAAGMTVEAPPAAAAPAAPATGEAAPAEGN